jgi:hypothetical protein
MSGGSTNSLGVARLLALALGLTVLVVGLATIAVGGAAASITGAWIAVIGGAIVVGTLLERVRYRSEAADRIGDPTGPGGGEPPNATLEPRFRRSEEVFADPTSGLRMRVWIDPSSGERRYVAEE